MSPRWRPHHAQYLLQAEACLPCRGSMAFKLEGRAGTSCLRSLSEFYERHAPLELRTEGDGCTARVQLFEFQDSIYGL